MFPVASTKKRAENKKNEPSDDGPKTENRGRKPIDIEPTSRAPASLLERVTAFHAYLYWVGLCTGGDRTQLIAGREWRFAHSPPDHSAAEIADRVVEWAFEERPKPGTRFKMWMRGRTDADDPKTERSRWASLRIVIDAQGELQVVDDPEAEDASQSRNAFRETMATIEMASRVIVDQMERVGKVTQHFVGVSESVAKLMAAHADTMKADHEAEFRMSQLLADVWANEQTMQYRHARLERMAKFFEPSSERIADFVNRVMSDMYQQTKERDPTMSKSAALESFVSNLSQSDQAAMSEVFTDDEHSLIAAMRQAPSNEEFDAIAERLGESLNPRAADVEAKIISVLGIERALKLRNLLR